MALDTVKFVDVVDTTRATRLDLNDGTTWRLTYEGTELVPPEFRRAVVSTLLRDGDHIPASAYGNRMLQLRFTVGAATADAVATEVQKLQRELNRANNVIEWKPSGATNPVFFRTFRSPPNSIQEWPGDSGRKVIQVEVEAEPFAVGLKETLTAATVNVDPAAASNGAFWDVTGVKGDVETPAIIKFPAGDVVETGRKQSVFGVRRRGTPSNTPYVLQAESMTANTDTSIQANDAAMSGAGQNFMRCTFATDASMQTRLFASPHPSSAAVDNRGRYRVFLRYRKSVGGDEIKVRIRHGDSSALVTNDAVTLASATSIFYADLGFLSMPLGPDPEHDGYSNSERSVRGVYLEVQAQRVSGTGNLDFDVLQLVPADDRLSLVKWPEFSGADDYWLDGTKDRTPVYSTMTAGEIRNTQIADVIGAPPMLTPNQTNRIFFIKDVGTGTGGEAIGGSSTATVSYYPRYVYVRPAST